MADYVWPLSGTTTAPDMNTSFGPRINRQQWDFHDGIDLKAPLGTPVLAMRSGAVHRAGPAGTHGFSSRHVVLEVNDTIDGVLYLVHVHLDSIDSAITEGAPVTQGQVIGTVGDDDAAYPHLHFEFRKSKAFERYSVHPLSYLPYTNTANFSFSAPSCNRFNRLNGLMAARLRFEAPNRAEGDLRRVEVELFAGPTALGARVVDFNDKATINEGIGDDLLFVNDIGVEGYQRSDLEADERVDLHYGVLIRNLPAACDRVIGRVIDVGGTIVESAAEIPSQTATNRLVDFEDGLMPPDGWTVISEPANLSTVTNDPLAAYNGMRGMRSAVTAGTDAGGRIGCIHLELPENRFEWMVEGRFRVKALQLADGQSLTLLQLRTDDGQLSVGARIRQVAGALRVGLVARRPDGTLTSEDSEGAPAIDVWRRWRLHVRRIGTRETTAILEVASSERARLNWNTVGGEPRAVRAGIALLSSGATATVFSDLLRVTEATALI